MFLNVLKVKGFVEVPWGTALKNSSTKIFQR
jgi:hypothetical protein